MRIDVLPDDVLLAIFHSFIKQPCRGKTGTEAWQSLIHVCRRWRSLILGSARSLNLQLFCTPETPVKDRLDVWPALPLIIAGNTITDNVVAALGQSNRVHEVLFLNLADWQFAKILAPMQVPFPELTYLRLWALEGTQLTIADSFLDGSAPRLQVLVFDSVSFPGLPRLLLSATYLVELHLEDIPHSGYISPEAMAAPLSVLSGLKVLSFGFQSPQSHPDQKGRSLPPPKRHILPALTTFRFKGLTEYIGELVSLIDTPQLDILDIKFFDQTDFCCPRLAQFISCTPKLRELDGAHLLFCNLITSVTFRSPTSECSFSCRELDRPISFIKKVCDSSLHPLSKVEDLYIDYRYSNIFWDNYAIENTIWLELLLPFTAVKNLYLCKEFAPCIAAALQELVGTRITEVLPSLQNISVEVLESSGPFQENIEQFVATRQLSNHSIAISNWNKYSNLPPIYI